MRLVLVVLAALALTHPAAVAQTTAKGETIKGQVVALTVSPRLASFSFYDDNWPTGVQQTYYLDFEGRREKADIQLDGKPLADAGELTRAMLSSEVGLRVEMVPEANTNGVPWTVQQGTPATCSGPNCPQPAQPQPQRRGIFRR